MKTVAVAVAIAVIAVGIVVGEAPGASAREPA
jgi:hypothetical protein